MSAERSCTHSAAAEQTLLMVLLCAELEAESLAHPPSNQVLTPAHSILKELKENIANVPGDMEEC